MDERRAELQLTWNEVAEKAGITREGLRRTRVGTGHIRSLTKHGIEKALAWERGSVDTILAGGEPTPTGPHVRVHDARMTTPAPALDVPTDEELRASGLQPETIDALLDMRRHVERLVAKRDEDAIRRANRVLRALDEGQDAG
jgi:hypothetical protein